MDIKDSGTPVNLTASGNIKTTPGSLVGFYVNSTNVGTLVLTRNGAGLGTITPAVGWHRYPLDFSTLACTIGGTALDVTFIVK